MSVTTVLKLIVAAAILALIASRVDFDASIDLMRAADPFWLAAAIGASLFMIVADAVFWSTSMRRAGLAMPFRSAILFGVVGWFFVNIAPSTVGADIFRAAQLKASGVPVVRAIRLVAAARFLSFAALIVFMAAGLPFGLGVLEVARDRIALLTVFAIALGIFAGVLSAKQILDLAPARLRRGPLDFAAALSGEARSLLRAMAPGGWSLLVLQHLLRFATVLALALALGLSFDPLVLFGLAPAAFLAAMIPISFGGWGVREASFVYFLGAAGIAAPAALAISILFGLTRILIGAAGGLIWIFARREHFAVAVDGGEDKVRTTS